MFCIKLMEKLEYELINKHDVLAESKMLIGFDGYIDKLVKLRKNQDEPPVYFSSVKEFSQHISNSSNQSADIEVEPICSKIGGNGPLMADATAEKSIETTCIGAFGYPKLHETFNTLAEKCTLISLEAPAESLAFEFYDGKLMFGDLQPLRRINWEHLCKLIPVQQMLALMEDSDLFGFVNWSGLLHSNDILNGICRDICPKLKHKKIIFFDIADPSAKNAQQFDDFLNNLINLRTYFKTILGLNPKEFKILYEQILKKTFPDNSKQALTQLKAVIPVDEITVHGLDDCLIADESGKINRVESELVLNPVTVTGGGDNFNSGYCAGKLIGLSSELCALLGNISSYLFVSNGKSCSFDDIIRFIHKKIH